MTRTIISLFDFLGYVIIALTLAIITISALKVSVDVPTFHLDGAFQTASGLFRLDSDQLPGRDFYPYLGVGPLLAVFPIYKIAGADLAATVFAAKFTVVFFSWLAVTILWHLVLRPVKPIYSFVGGALILFGIHFVAEQASLNNIMSFAMEPGNSLRPLRAALPYLLAITFYFAVRRIDTSLRSYLIGISLGIALLWSNDLALPTFGLFLLFSISYFYSFERKNWKRNAVNVAVTSLLTWFVLLAVITGGNPLDLLKYNFLDVAKDQWWYFGPYGSNTRVFEIFHFTRIFSREIYFSIVVFIAVLLLAAKNKRIEYFLVAAIGLTLFASGSLASVGGHLGGYFGGFIFWSVVTSVMLLINALSQIKLFTIFRSPLLLIPVLLVFLGILGFGIIDYKKKLDFVKTDQSTFYVDELGGFLDSNYRDYIDYARQHRELVAVEDYWGLWNSLNRSFPPWPVDSVIHALGSVRETSKKALENADVIITTRYSTSPMWQPWNLSQNFWFYDELITQWEPTFVSPTTMIWKRADNRRVVEAAKCRVSTDGQSIILEPGFPGFYRVMLSYASSSLGGRYLLMFKNNISYGADANGFVSLQPGASDATFPVLIRQSDDNQFEFNSVGNAVVSISSCYAEKIFFENKDLLHIRKPEDFSD